MMRKPISPHNIYDPSIQPHGDVYTFLFSLHKERIMITSMLLSSTNQLGLMFGKMGLIP
jgi:hypothetical protein